MLQRMLFRIGRIISIGDVMVRSITLLLACCFALAPIIDF